MNECSPSQIWSIRIRPEQYYWVKVKIGAAGSYLSVALPYFDEHGEIEFWSVVGDLSPIANGFSDRYRDWSGWIMEVIAEIPQPRVT